ncbi:DUF2264 domain-containing protein [Streptomyces sp. ICBB 8177]|uniref:DUF2264 domain-containing protein n=1 Tax=Streptomyces sp. ICBB 8177 TaxID=563922 RepID=UPI001F545DE4|nr:DUF2264 domain-containing protein [Streptomyces sp. ICBB 8177]
MSPRTGWTRAHWEAVADRLLDALVPYASPGFARYDLPGRGSRSGPRSDGLEGFARSFLLASFRIAGALASATTRHPLPAHGPVEALITRYARGLTTGTDPSRPDAWPPIAERSQPMVEAASVAIGLHETRPWIWDRLDDRERLRVVEWLSGFTGKHTWDNNWRLFQVVVEQFLASVGAPYDREAIEGGLDRIEDWYVGEGWYSDGEGRHFDYYNAWALHFYPLLWSRIAASTPGRGADPARVAAYRERLRLFLDGYRYFFGADGAPVHQGRSLTYRFATAAPLWMGALADATPLAPGLTRRIASGTLRHFAERGAPDADGLLRLGWYGPFLPVTQTYSGPGSPYWASKGFLGLLLPATHPVWTERELPCPVEESDVTVALRGPGWLLHGTRRDGIVRLLNHGSDHEVAGGAGSGPPDGRAGADAATDAVVNAVTDAVAGDPHYAKLAYSSRTAPQSAPEAWRRGIDNHFALLSPDGAPSSRTAVHPIAVTSRAASSWHTARVETPGDAGRTRSATGTPSSVAYRVETTAMPYGAWEARVHRVRRVEPDAAAAPGLAGRRPAAGCAAPGHPLARHPAACRPAAREGGHALADAAEPVAATGDGWALVRRRDGLTSAVVGLHGWDAAAVEHAVDANAFGRHSAVPYLTAAGGQRDGGSGRAPEATPGGHVYVSLVGLSGVPLDEECLRRTREETAVEPTDGEVVIRFPDGTELRA